MCIRDRKGEITEHHVYKRLAKHAGENRKVLEKISNDELLHYAFWKKISGRDVKPNRFKILWYTLLAKTLGVTFALKLMESGEQGAQQMYSAYKNVNGVPKIIRDEQAHEARLIGLLKDESLEYTGSVVLGLNDALVELTGALAGMTLAIQDSKIVATAGLVTGLAAALSMGASNYLASKEDSGNNRSPMKSALYTGLTYLAVVAILIAPYFIFSNIFASLAATLGLAILVIATYTFYITTAKDKKFWPQFAEMALISITTAAISFGFGLLLNQWFGL